MKLLHRFRREPPRFDPALWTAVFDVDDLTAENAAVSWLNHTDEEDINYTHHRLLAGISRRLGSRPALEPYKRLLSRIERQLWARAVSSLRDFGVLSKQLSDMHMPFFLHGNLLWHAAGNPALNDLETIEIMVPQEGMTFASTQLWGRGWQAGPMVSSIFAPDPLVLSRPGFAHICIQSDACLKSRGLNEHEIWHQRFSAKVLANDIMLPDQSVVSALYDVPSGAPFGHLQTAVNVAEFRKRYGSNS